MGLFKKPIENAMTARDKARAEAADWDAKAAAIRAEANELDATANDMILADETAAERITLQVNTLQRKADAYAHAATKAHDKARLAAREILNVEAGELDKEAAKIRKVADNVEIEVAKAKAALEELDGCTYERTSEESSVLTESGEPSSVTQSTGKAGEIRWNAQLLETQAQVIRYWLAENELPATLDDLNAKVRATHQTGYFGGGSALNRYGDPITDNLREALGDE